MNAAFDTAVLKSRSSKFTAAQAGICALSGESFRAGDMITMTESGPVLYRWLAVNWNTYKIAVSANAIIDAAKGGADEVRVITKTPIGATVGANKGGRVMDAAAYSVVKFNAGQWYLNGKKVSEAALMTRCLSNAKAYEVCEWTRQRAAFSAQLATLRSEQA